MHMVAPAKVANKAKTALEVETAKTLLEAMEALRLQGRLCRSFPAPTKTDLLSIAVKTQVMKSAIISLETSVKSWKETAMTQRRAVKAAKRATNFHSS